MNHFGTTTELASKAQSTLIAIHDLPVPLSRRGRLVRIALAIGLCALLAFGPLAFGAVDEWAVCVLELGAALLLIIWAMGELASRQFEVTPNVLFFPAALFGGLVAAQLLLRTTSYWYATWQKGLLWSAFAIVLFLTTQCFRRAAWRNNLAVFFTIFGFMVALFAIAQQFTSNGKIYWVVPNQNGGWMYGPYVNHAHYAGLMEMLVPFPLVFAMAHFSRRPVRMLFGFAALIMASTIFLSQSVGGIFAFGAEILLLAILLARGRHSLRNMAWLALLCVILGGWLVALRPVGLVERLAALRSPMDKADAGIRADIVKDSFKLMKQRPLVGWGLGTFPTVYPSFRSFYSKFEVNEAHNDFVQLLVETGVAGFSLMVGFLVLLYRAGMRNIEHWRRDPGTTVTVAALIGCTGFLVHSLSDFGLQIPANAALFFALTAIVTSGATFDRDRFGTRY